MLSTEVNQINRPMALMQAVSLSFAQLPLPTFRPKRLQTAATGALYSRGLEAQVVLQAGGLLQLDPRLIAAVILYLYPVYKIESILNSAFVS